MAEHAADYSKHTDEELREAIAKSKEQEPRVAAEDSDEALQADLDQRRQMEEELARRQA